ncbi:MULTISPECIES: hypothetical protein [Nitrosomonas]|uniref:Histidine kinase-, DNA gyrase B-, and HSP90-like ATPase n=1 Tax=Nitrosomonas europaea (strain ATCC 19718 / CIP 103999 / KCTC 2705 / NBRC 14298) TaxID=228410 RepID=Q82UU2_NITEU|nr:MULTISPECIES: hypothetical protein [Nitrosomonas]CAD85292.1 hypothetical protein NE1381 [Nitrosomonas europaea ATCC 19718]SDW09169.1 hypothetical protein SAMN05216310_1034 [Nitrosomonas europaea]SES72340.1 hypothetical protein SAMN05216309_1034 [Nitrosomonas europaea]SJZ32832.1 hypothetical protein SAMN02745113_00484 [Nitrosomonas europaea]HBF25795.1 hypothetical protein [Nitrosomonas sp.]
MLDSNKGTSKVIVAPKIFDINKNENRGNLTIFLGKLRKYFTHNGSHEITIDFTQTEKFIAAGTLLFYSELAYLKQFINNETRLRYIPPKNPKAFEVLIQIELYKLCGIRKPKSKNANKYDDVLNWKVACGNVVNNEQCAPTIEAYEGQLAEPLIDGIFKGLAEAMTNTVHHAYAEIREDGLNHKPSKNNWWMFSQARDGELTVVFCDLGIGIPRSLPKKHPSIFHKMLSLGKISDHQCIASSVELNATSTKMPGRGKGLGNIIEIASKNKAGGVIIYSNKGMYRLGPDATEPFSRDLKNSILGTIICWNVTLSKVGL